jgi:hypothetical protein
LSFAYFGTLGTQLAHKILAFPKSGGDYENVYTFLSKTHMLLLFLSFNTSDESRAVLGRVI